MGDCYRVPVFRHPGHTLIHYVERAVALLVPHLAHLEQHVLTAGGHLVLRPALSSRSPSRRSTLAVSHESLRKDEKGDARRFLQPERA